MSWMVLKHILTGSMETFMKKQMNALVSVHFLVCSSHISTVILLLMVRKESLRICMAMEPYSENAANAFKLSANDDWLRQRQGLALPVLPPTTPEARQYFFTKIHEYAMLASGNDKSKINYEIFAQDWNQSADGRTRYYVTTEVLAAYAKTWEKINNIHASKELISRKITAVQQSRQIFAAPQSSFPEFITGTATSMHPRQGVINLYHMQSPPSLSTELPVSVSSMPQFIPPSRSDNSTPNITPLSDTNNLGPVCSEQEQPEYNEVNM